MRGRARSCILSAFAFACIIQLAIIFVYFPSSSINNGLLLDESAFPASPALRMLSKTRSAPNTSAIEDHRPDQHEKIVTARTQNVPTQPAQIDQFHRHSIYSAVVSTAPVVSTVAEKQAILLSHVDPKYDLVLCLHSI